MKLKLNTKKVGVIAIAVFATILAGRKILNPQLTIKQIDEKYSLNLVERSQKVNGIQYVKNKYSFTRDEDPWKREKHLKLEPV